MKVSNLNDYKRSNTRKEKDILIKYSDPKREVINYKHLSINHYEVLREDALSKADSQGYEEFGTMYFSYYENFEDYREMLVKKVLLDTYKVSCED